MRKITVTATSRPLPVSEGDSACKRADSLDLGRVARLVHRCRGVVAPVVLLAALGAGCVFPPSLELEDAGVDINAAPVIVDVRDEAGNTFERPGPREIVVGQGRLVLTLSDPDLDDTLSVHYFLDYGLPDPTPARIKCEAAPGAEPTLERQITCSLVGVCTSTALGPDHIFEIEVFDRPPIVDDNTRLFRKLDPPGQSSTWWWKVTCVEGAR